MKFEFTDEELAHINKQHSESHESLSKLDESVQDSYPSEDNEDGENDTESDVGESDDTVERLRAWKEGNEEYQ